ncbi:hypothetical protein P9112_009201 [Eukaryota sp. TZLM1-RC]
MAMLYISFFTFKKLIQCGDLFQEMNINKLACHTVIAYKFPIITLITKCSVLLFSLGCISAYGIISTDNLYSTVSTLFPSVSIPRPLISFLLHLCVFYPLSSTENLKSLKSVSSIAVLVIASFGLFIVYNVLFYGLKGKFANDLVIVNTSFDYFYGFGILAFAFAVHTSGLQLYAELNMKSVEKMVRISRIGFIIVFAILSVFGMGGYLLFGSSADANILQTFNQNNGFVQMFNFLILLLIIASYPILAHVAKESLQTIFTKRQSLVEEVTTPISSATPMSATSGFLSDTSVLAFSIDESNHADDVDVIKRPSKLIRMIVTACLCTLTFIASFFPNSLDLVLGLTGSLSGSFLVYILPCMVALSVQERLGLSSGEVMVCKLSIGLGIGCGVLGSVQSVFI